MPVRLVTGVHPCLQTLERLIAECSLRMQRRSGPGGQHRNKTSSGVFLTHDPTAVVAEATERRSQADNRRVALRRLRYRLALDIRTESALLGNNEGSLPSEEVQLRSRYQKSVLQINEANEVKPAVLALVLNDLHASGGQPSLVARHWQVSTSKVIRFTRECPDAFAWLNQVRQHHKRPPLK